MTAFSALPRIEVVSSGSIVCEEHLGGDTQGVLDEETFAELNRAVVERVTLRGSKRWF